MSLTVRLAVATACLFLLSLLFAVYEIDIWVVVPGESVDTFEGDSDRGIAFRKALASTVGEKVDRIRIVNITEPPSLTTASLPPQPSEVAKEGGVREGSTRRGLIGGGEYEEHGGERRLVGQADAVVTIASKLNKRLGAEAVALNGVWVSGEDATK
jgi:hypothetical protein